MQRVWRREDASGRNRRGTGLRGVLVAVGGNDLDAEVITTACNLVKGTKAFIYAVHVIEMPWSEAVDDSPGDAIVMGADRLLEHAAEIASAHGYKLEPELLQARNAGVALVDEAAARNCDVIIVGLPYKREHGVFTLGDTVPYVLEHSPINVWVIRTPEHIASPAH